MPRDIPDDRGECWYRTRDPMPCTCKPGKCVAPTAERIKEANAQDANVTVLGDKQFWVWAGVSSEWRGDGTSVHKEFHFDGRPTKVTTYRNGRRKVTYERQE